MNKPGIATIAISAAVLTLVAGGASAATLIGSNQIKDDSVRSVDIQDGTIHGRDLTDSLNADLSKPGPKGDTGAQGVQGPQGPVGLQGPVGPQSLNGTVYRVAHYTGGANGGAIATVACADDNATSQQYIAISGGVQIINADGDDSVTNDSNVAVADSFPGRMNFTDDPAGYTTKAGRLDGWIVRFGDNTKSAAQVNVWAICVKRPADVSVQTTDY
jgi:hypothetical protein